MKNKYHLAIKFFTESKNEEQIEISYKEIENFMETYEEFKYFLNFTVEIIPIELIETLTEEER